MRETPCDYCGQPTVWEFGKLDGYDYRRGVISRHVCPAPDLGPPPNERAFCPTCNALKTFCECAQPRPAAKKPAAANIKPIPPRQVAGKEGGKGGVMIVG